MSYEAHHAADVRDLTGTVEALALSPDEYLIVGVTALRLTGYVQHPGRLDLVVTEPQYDRLFQDERFAYTAEPVQDGPEINEMIHVPPDTVGRQRIHIINRWMAIGIGRQMRYDNYVGDPALGNAEGFPVLDPVTSLKWLLARGYREDRSAAFLALSGLRQERNPSTGELSRWADGVWPQSHGQRRRQRTRSHAPPDTLE